MKKYEQLKIENQLCFSLYAASREMIKLYKPILDEYHLTYTQYITMMVLWEKEKATVKEVGHVLHLDSGTLTPLLKKLEAMKYIRKYRSPKDDRVVIVEVTDIGLDLKEQMHDVPQRVFCQMNGTVEEYKALKNSLDELLVKLG